CLIITQHNDHNNNASCSILCNNVGALFVHAIAENTTVSDILHHLLFAQRNCKLRVLNRKGCLIITQHNDHNNNAFYSILCNNVGALFVHAIAENTTVFDILHHLLFAQIHKTLSICNVHKNIQQLNTAFAIIGFQNL
ncbi:hypothetical protein RYX36_001276, partial [Vicia faba]